MRVIGSLVALGEASPAGPVIVDQRDSPPLGYGTHDKYYLIIGANKIKQKVVVRVPKVANPDRTWFVAQYVEAMTESEVFRELTANLSGANERNVFAKTASCKNCSFPLIVALKEIVANGGAVCPHCRATIILNELTFSVFNPMDTEGAPVQGPVPVIEATAQDPEMHKARLTMGNYLDNLRYMPHDGTLCDALFDPAPEEQVSGRDLLFESREDYIRLIQDIQTGIS